MFNFITQQRRGTTEEWAESTIIPLAGEFVIEERKNEPVRVKIGDGVHLFKDLKYIDQETVAALTNLEARYNAHVAYIEGGTPVPDSTLATEVLDARYIDGTNYASLNAAIQGVSDKRIGGMIYDYNGELGLKQPYMLYLTDKDNNIIEETGVYIISGGSGGGGSGGGSSSILKISYITTSPLVVTPDDSAILKFTFSGTDSSGDAILQASATWKVDGKIVSYGTVKDGENEFDVTKYIKLGTSKVLLTVVDDSGGVVTKNWSVQQVDVRIESNFNDKETYPLDSVIFDYIPHGAVDKKVHISLDGQEIAVIDTPAKISGSVVRYEIPAQTHGSHILDAYIEANINENTVISNHIQKDILWYDETSDVPVIGTISQKFTAKQYDTTNIEYTVYDPLNEFPEVVISVDGAVVSRVTMTTPTNVFAFNSSEVGVHNITITCGKSVKHLIATIEKLDIDIAPVTTGLVFDFNPIGRSNDDSNKLWSYDDDIKMTVSDNFDWINGGYKQDEQGDTYFCIKSGTTATITYNLFGDDAKKTGKEMKLIFKTTNVSDPETTFMSCVDNTTEVDHIGITMHAHQATIYGQNGKLDLDYSEEDIIEFEFNISSATETVPMIMGYEDGVSTRPLVYDQSFSFKQNTPQPITFGSDNCDVHIYRMKAYSTSLTNVDILNNFIADARTTDEMRARYNRNQIYDENQNLTAEALAEKCPWLRIYKLSAPHFTNNKSDKVKGTTIQQIYKGGDPVLDNWTAYQAQHSGQGTSSNNYGAAGRNLDFIMNKDGCYIELGDGTQTQEISLTRTSVPVAYLNAKVNIASSNNLTNAILANRYNQFNPYRRPFVREEGYPLENIKDTMEFHNCVIFIQETDPDLTTHREFADTDWHFYAIGNIGDSKKTDNTRATDPEDELECCVEIMDVGLPLSAFPVDTMMNAMSYTVDEITGDRVYTWAKDENLGILFEKTTDGSYILTSDTHVNLDKTYYVDILENDDFSEDYTYGWRYIFDDEDENILNTCKQKWIEFYRFVTTSSDEEFKSNLKDYFVVDSALYYYLFTTRYCMVDNRAKNTFWHYSKTSDGTYKWDLCWDYDNDTSLGLNNYGKQVYRYGLEDIDKDDAGQEVFRQSDSLFFCRIRDLFGPELKSMYKTLDSQNAWNAESLIQKSDDWQSEFPEELWRIDIERKYIRTYTSSFIDGKGDSQFLVNMANGKMKYHRRQWERNQEQYMASKYQTTRASGDNYHANLRVNRFDNTENLVIKPDYQLTLTPYSYIYLNVWYGDVTRTPYTVRAVPNVPTTVPCPTSLDADIINIGSAAAIRDFGDLSKCYPKTISIGNADRVKTLKLGTNVEGYDNASFDTLTTGANPLLEEINVENISGLSQSLNLSSLINLKKLYAFGTSVSGVTFAEGGKLELAQLPPVNSLVLKNLMYLSTDNLILEGEGTSGYRNVVDLTVESCPLIDSIDLLTRCTKLRRARLIDVDLPKATYTFFETNIFKLKGLNSNGDETPNAWITGTAHFDNLTGTQYQELKRRYPHLTVSYDLLTCSVTFKSTDLVTPLYTQTVYNEANCEDPVNLGLAEMPTKDQTVSTTYSWSGWSKLTDGQTVEVSPLLKVDDDIILYPTFDEEVRKYEVKFFNNNGALLNTYLVDYGTQEFIYPDVTPVKEGVSNPENYEFKSWKPEPKNIVGSLDCYATYELKEDAIYDIALEDISYVLDTAELLLTITKYNNNAQKTIRIPETYTIDGVDYTVGAIIGIDTSDEHVTGFSDCDLEYVILPETITNIGAYAFYNNKKITTITIPDAVTQLGVAAFGNCNGLLEVYYNAVNATVIRNSGDPYVFNNTASNIGYSLYIGKNVTKIPSYVFTQSTSDTDKLYGATSIEFAENSACEIIESYAFSRTHVTSVTLPESLLEIRSSAFEYSDFEELILPSNVTTIGSDAFSNCPDLTYVYIPSSLISMNSQAFKYTLNTEFDIEEGSIFVWKNHCMINTKTKTVLFGREDSIIPEDMGLTTIGSHCFNEVNIVSLVIPEGITTIGEHAVNNCKQLTHIELPMTLTRIENFGFYGFACYELVLPMNLQSIGLYSLVDNPNLKTITIPANVRTIGYEFLRGCTALTSVKFETSDLIISKPSDAFSDLFTGDSELSYIEVNWNSDGSVNKMTRDVSYPFANINKDAPWKAGTNSSGVQIIPVTVKYIDKELVYNIDVR